MSNNHRRTYTKEFKIEAVRLIQERGTIAEAARDLGIGEQMLGRWKKQLETDQERAFPGRGKPRDEEVAILRREVALLRMERDILKKAVGIFSGGNR